MNDNTQSLLKALGINAFTKRHGQMVSDWLDDKNHSPTKLLNSLGKWEDEDLDKLNEWIKENLSISKEKVKALLIEILVEDWVMLTDDTSIATGEEEIVDLWTMGHEPLNYIQLRAKLMYHSRDFFTFIVKVMNDPLLAAELKNQLPEEQKRMSDLIRTFSK